ncbi:unnamed protein product [Cuscuta campestris]|uniref:BAR domain-containing protein n=1 Tax=Cuscuta campestris TaxID=132261 RepID=A0A484MGH2_9ASTE|nr:unnamed protein product [Cuscuta campestris]
MARIGSLNCAGAHCLVFQAMKTETSSRERIALQHSIANGSNSSTAMKNLTFLRPDNDTPFLHSRCHFTISSNFTLDSFQALGFLGIDILGFAGSDPMPEGAAHPPCSLDDSPMFRQQMQSMEENAEVLKEKCLKFCKGCRKYSEGLLEAYDRDISFASALEVFGGVHDDQTSVAFGGPDMVNCAIALREIGTYKETLRSQVEDVLIERLQHLAMVELPHVKEARKRFDKANVIYDQAREKFLALRKNTRLDICVAIEERAVPGTSPVKIEF